jgi:hypothetical protein
VPLDIAEKRQRRHRFILSFEESDIAQIPPGHSATLVEVGLRTIQVNPQMRAATKGLGP